MNKKNDINARDTSLVTHLYEDVERYMLQIVDYLVQNGAQQK